MWKKSFAVSVRFSSELFSLIFLYASIEKVRDTRLIWLIDCVFIFRLKNILSIIALSLSIINCLKATKPKLLNNNKSFFWINIKKPPPMRSWFIFFVSVENCKSIFPSFLFYYIVKFYIFYYWIWRINTHKVFFKSSFVSIFQFFNIDVGYSISTSHHSPPYLISLNQCLIVKSFLLFCFFILLVPKLNSCGG